jgi:hypothetical protein
LINGIFKDLDVNLFAFVVGETKSSISTEIRKLFPDYVVSLEASLTIIIS